MTGFAFSQTAQKIAMYLQYISHVMQQQDSTYTYI